jgi:hypothetical protein
MISNGMFSGLVSAPSSVISKASSQLHMEGSLKVCDYNYPQHGALIDEGADPRNSIPLHDIVDPGSSSVEHENKPEVTKHNQIHVLDRGATGVGHI